MADVIKQQWVGDSSDAQKAVKDLAAQITAMENSNAKAAAKMTKDMEKLRQQLQTSNQALQSIQTSSQSAGQGLTSMEGIAQQLQNSFWGMLSPWLKITAGIGAARAAAQSYFSYVEGEKRRGEGVDLTQRSIGAMQAELFNSFSGSSLEEKRWLADQATRIRREAKFSSEKPILSALVASGSSTQGNLKKSVEAVEYAAKLAGPGADPQTLIELAQAATDLERSTGVPGMKENLSFMLAAQEQHRAVGLKESATVIPRGVAALTSSLPARAGRDKKVDASEAMAMLAVLSHGATDKEGNLSTTGAFPIAEDMAKFFSSGMDIPGMGRGGGPLHLQASEKPDTLAGQLAYLQSHPEEAEMFLQGVHAGRKILIPTFRRLLRNDPEATRLFQDARSAGLKSFGPDIYNQTVSDLRSGTPEMEAMFSASDMAGEAETAQKGLTAAGVMARVRAARDKDNELYRNGRGWSQGVSRWMVDTWRDRVQGERESIVNYADDAAMRIAAYDGGWEKSDWFSGNRSDADLLKSVDATDRVEVQRLLNYRKSMQELLKAYDATNPEASVNAKVQELLNPSGFAFGGGSDHWDVHENLRAMGPTYATATAQDMPAKQAIAKQIQDLLDLSDEYARNQAAIEGDNFSYNAERDPAVQALKRDYRLSDDQIQMLETRRDFERFGRRPDLAPAVRAEARGGGER